MKRCLNCDNEISSQKKFCSKNCFYEYSKKNSGAMRICEFCGKEFYKRGNPKRGKYCSKKCTGSARKKGEIISCEYCGKEIYKCRVHLNRSKNFFCSIECSNKFQGQNKIKCTCKICGKEFLRSKSRENSIYCNPSCRYSDKDYLRYVSSLAQEAVLKNKGLNKLELAGQLILKEIGIIFIEQVLLFNKFLVDVLLPGYNIVIQWDGDYWHCHPRFKNPDERQIKSLNKDKSQNAYFKKCGVTLLRFWESDIIKNKEQVIDTIKRAIQRAS